MFSPAVGAGVGAGVGAIVLNLGTRMDTPYNTRDKGSTHDP